MISLLIVFLFLISLVFIYLNTKYSYWKLKGVEQLKTNFLLGNITKLKSLHHVQLIQEVYNNFKGRAKVAGVYIFTKPLAVILDLDVVNAVLIKDFNKFSSRMTYNNDRDILSGNLFNVEGPLWRPLRNKFTPTFTSAKMKYMLPSILTVADEFARTYDRYTEKSNIINIRDLNGRYFVDVIGTCIFGLQCNSLKDPTSEFRQISLKIFSAKNFNIKWQLFKVTYVEIMKFVGVKKYPQTIEDFFLRVVREGVMEREKQGIVRNDFVDILLELKRSEDISLSYDQIAAQFFIFFTAGFETSSSTMSIALFELGRHLDIQEKLRNEILEVLKKYNNELTFEAMKDMEYLDQVITETLRMYSPLSFLERVSSEEFRVPGTDITLAKGTQVYIPLRAIHYDPEIYDNPLEFRPERFTASEFAKRHPQSFLSFGDGPRNCIGLRLGRIQMKIGLIKLLSQYRFSHSAETCKEIVYSDHTKGLLLTTDIYLRVDKLRGKQKDD